MPSPKLSKEARSLAATIVRQSLFLGEWPEEDQVTGHFTPHKAEGIWDECVEQREGIDNVIREAEVAADASIDRWLDQV